MIPLALIGMGAGLVGQVVGGIGSANEMNKSRKVVDDQLAENKSMYNQDYYGDYTKRADVQNVLGRMRDQMKENIANRRNTAAVTGATPEVAVAEQKADNEAMGETISNIAGQGAAFKQSAREAYRNQQNYLLQKKQAGYENNAAQWNNFGTNAGKLMASGGSSLIDELTKKKA